MPNSSLTAFLVDQIARAHDGDPWHGSSRASILADVTAEEAVRHAAPAIHSIWELVLHMTAWTQEVTRRLQGHAASLPEMGDWPAPPRAADEKSWRAAIGALDQAHVALLEATKRVDRSRLDAPVNDERNRELGTGVTFAQTINGLVQHDAYHSGQIALLKKMLRGR
ncbi:MAG TPA: DinB family protein [Gemmatimonadaceae bacterium]|nr:DinB family protein [Gemmatimonadaceae bacterium]